MTVAKGSAGINSAEICIWWWRQICLLCQDFVYMSVPTMAASPPHCSSSVACITPSPLPFLFPASSTGTWHSCQSCTISEAAGAARACPAIFPFLSSFSPHPSDGFCVSPPHYLKSSVSTSLFMVHSVFAPGFLFSVWLIWVSLLILYLSTPCSVRLPSNLIFVSFVSLLQM